MPKFILTQGIGFSPGSVKYVPTLGFTSSTVIPPKRIWIMGWLRD